MSNATGPENPEQFTPDIDIDTPVGLLPDLSEWGIEEIDRGICLDTNENRAIIREHKARYQIVFDRAGNITDYIQVITPEMSGQAIARSKGPLLTNKADINSDYVTGVGLLIEDQAELLVPGWVYHATRRYVQLERERDKARREGKTGPGTSKAMLKPSLLGPPSRCRALKIDGNRCANWAGGNASYNGFCKYHLVPLNAGGVARATAGPGYEEKVRNRLSSMGPHMLDMLEELAETATSEPVKLGAIKDLLDRGGFRVPTESNATLTVNIQQAGEEIRNRLQKLAIAQTVQEPEPEPEYAEIIIEEDNAE